MNMSKIGQKRYSTIVIWYHCASFLLMITCCYPINFGFFFFQVDIFSFKYLLFPLHSNNHWTLVVGNTKKKSLMYYDSLNGSHELSVSNIETMTVSLMVQCLYVFIPTESLTLAWCIFSVSLGVPQRGTLRQKGERTASVESNTLLRYACAQIYECLH